MAILIIKIFIFLLLAFLAGHGAVYIMNHIPAAWLCDYGEDPWFVDHPHEADGGLRGDEVQSTVHSEGSLHGEGLHDSEPHKGGASQSFSGKASQDENCGGFLKREDEREWEEKYGIPQRVKGHPYKLLFSALFSLCFLWLTLGRYVPFGEKIDFAALASAENIGMELASAAALFVLLLIGISDRKYMIIPDQFTAALAICGIGFLPYHLGIAEMIKLTDENASWIASHGFVSPLIGALSAGGIFLLTGLLTKWIFKKETLGTGDVKLMLSVGIIIGIYHIIDFIIAAFFICAIRAAWLLLRKKIKADDSLPMGDVIAAVCAAYILFII